MECKNCGKNFQWNESRVRQYCSRECFFANHRRISKCPTCGKERILQKKQPQKDFCSLTCWGLANRTRQFSASCLVCKQEFRTRYGKPNKYCSQKCSSTGRRMSPEHHRQRTVAYTRRWRKENPEKRRLQKNKRRALEHGAEGNFTLDDLEEIKKRFGNRCAICGKKKLLTIDHIIPLSRGGSNFKENIQPLCRNCNSRKHAKILVKT